MHVNYSSAYYFDILIINVYTFLLSSHFLSLLSGEATRRSGNPRLHQRFTRAEFPCRFWGGSSMNKKEESVIVSGALLDLIQVAS